MRSNPHGIALVISNIKYREGLRLETRSSAVVDEGRARAMFEALHYTVVLFRDLTADEMTMAFQLVAGSRSFDSLPPEVQGVWRGHGYSGTVVTNGDDSFVCCLMAHGGRDVAFGIDKSSFSTELDSFSKLVGPRSCPHLAGKPKMVFIQCCQGEKTAVPVEVMDDGLTSSPQSCLVQDDGGKVTITHKSDFCIFYASVPDEKSYRSKYDDPRDHEEKGGSWYIHALHEAIVTRKVRSIMTLTTEVNRLVSEKQEVGVAGSLLKQCPVMYSTLRYDVQF